MNTLKIALLWCLAAIVAVWAYLRLRRGKVTLLQGRFSPAFLRMVAVLIVYFQGGCPEPKDPRAATKQQSPTSEPGAVLSPTIPPTSAPVSALHKAPKDFPASLDVWALYQLRNDYAWAGLKLQLSSSEQSGDFEAALLRVRDLGSTSLQTALTEYLTQRKEGKPETFEQLCTLLDTFESSSLYDEWLAGYVWRRLRAVATDASIPQGLADDSLRILLGRLNYHQRVLGSLLLGESEVGAVTFRPWLSKAGPPAGYKALVIPTGLKEAAQKRFPSTTAGTWDSEAALTFTVKSAPKEARLYHNDQAFEVKGSFPLGRLDLLVAKGGAVTLTHPTLGELTISEGEALSAWNVERFLSKTTTSALSALVEKASKGDSGALVEIEKLLPATQGLIRASLAKDPSSKGAPSLRTLLTLFDE